MKMVATPAWGKALLGFEPTFEGKLKLRRTLSPSSRFFCSLDCRFADGTCMFCQRCHSAAQTAGDRAARTPISEAGPREAIQHMIIRKRRPLIVLRVGSSTSSPNLWYFGLRCL